MSKKYIMDQNIIHKANKAGCPWIYRFKGYTGVQEWLALQGYTMRIYIDDQGYYSYIINNTYDSKCNYLKIENARKNAIEYCLDMLLY